MSDTRLLPPGVTPRQDDIERTERLSVPVSEAEKERFQRACQRLRVSMSAVARSLVEQWIGEVQSHLDAQANKRTEEQTNADD